MHICRSYIHVHVHMYEDPRTYIWISWDTTSVYIVTAWCVLTKIEHLEAFTYTPECFHVLHVPGLETCNTVVGSKKGVAMDLD